MANKKRSGRSADKGHTRNVTPADREAAARLKAIWMAIPKDRRPTQHELGERWGEGGNQSLISQYMNAYIALNYRAVLFFCKELGCRPEDIRTDLPEQQATSDQQTIADLSLMVVALTDALTGSIPGAAAQVQAYLQAGLARQPAGPGRIAQQLLDMVGPRAKSSGQSKQHKSAP